MSIHVCLYGLRTEQSSRAVPLPLGSQKRITLPLAQHPQVCSGQTLKVVLALGGGRCNGRVYLGLLVLPPASVLLPLCFILSSADTAGQRVAQQDTQGHLSRSSMGALQTLPTEYASSVVMRTQNHPPPIISNCFPWYPWQQSLGLPLSEAEVSAVGSVSLILGPTLCLAVLDLGNAKEDSHSHCWPGDVGSAPVMSPLVCR